MRLVLDTSVLIADPTCVLEFEDADVVVPLTVVEELDGLKTRPDDVGRAATHGAADARGAARAPRRIARPPGAHRQRHRHAADRDQQHPPAPADRARPRPVGTDNRIIGAAIGQSDFGPTTMVSNDAALRIKAAHLGVSAAEHRLTRGATTIARPSGGRRSTPPTRRSTASTPPERSPPMRSRPRPPSSSARTSSPCCAADRSRRWSARSTTSSSCCRKRCPRRGGCGRAARSSGSRSSSCSIPTSR